MASKHGKRYSPKFKFQVVLEALQSDKSDAEIARAYDVHPVTVSRWKQEFKENGPEVFGGDEEVKEYERRISQLERMLGLLTAGVSEFDPSSPPEAHRIATRWRAEVNLPEEGLVGA